MTCWISDLKIKKEDYKALEILIYVFTDIFILGKEQEFTELGERLEYFGDKYGKEIIQQIIQSDEISSMIIHSQYARDHQDHSRLL